jgi:hypothetical protein
MCQYLGMPTCMDRPCMRLFCLGKTGPATVLTVCAGMDVALLSALQEHHCVWPAGRQAHPHA